MWKVKDEIELKELEKFGYIKMGGTAKEFYYWGWYVKYVRTLFNVYEIRVFIQSNKYKEREIIIFRDLTLDESFRNAEIIKPKKKLIRDLMKAGLVEKVEKGR